MTEHGPCPEFVRTKASGGGDISAAPKTSPTSASHKNRGFGRTSPLTGEEGATPLQGLDLERVLVVVEGL
jgi:hypothetical protein